MIKNYGVMGVVCLCVWGSSLFAEGPKNIIVIGWDGAQRAHVQEMTARDELPNLTALSRQGKLIDIDVTNGATDTKAGWTQILTGYSCEITGVYNTAVISRFLRGTRCLSVSKSSSGRTISRRWLLSAKRGMSITMLPAGLIMTNGRPPSRSRKKSTPKSPVWAIFRAAKSLRRTAKVCRYSRQALVCCQSAHGPFCEWVAGKQKGRRSGDGGTG